MWILQAFYMLIQTHLLELSSHLPNKVFDETVNRN